MSGKVVGTPNKVRSAYDDFLNFFQIAVEDNDGQVFFPDAPLHSSFTDSGGARVEFKRCLYIKNLPCRKLSAGKRLDLVIMGMEELEKNDPWTVKKSTVYLNYFVVSNSAAQMVQALHFDFDEKGQADHAFFHVQLSDEPIPQGDRLSVHFDFPLKAAVQSNECWVTTRIPTPDMTLTSVLYCVAADHLRSDIFGQFADKVDPIQGRLPPLRFDALRNSVEKSPLHFKSFHWFAHARETTEQSA
jgi:hypothetical protein